MAGRVIVLATMKGGSGKSTTAMCLAVHWWRLGRPTAIIDADPQRSVLRWARTGGALEDLHVEVVDGAPIGGAMSGLLGNGFERIVVDSPGFRAPVTEAALARADLALVPMKASPVDFDVAADTVDLIRSVGAGRGRRGPPDYRFLLTQTVRGSVVARHMRAELASAGYPLLQAELVNRVVHAESPFAGSTPTLTEPKGRAARDIADLTEEIDALLA